jgi:hypothetical protein
VTLVIHPGRTLSRAYQREDSATTDIIRGTPRSPWLRAEIDVVVAAYLDMLVDETRGQRVNKAARVRDLEAILTARNHAAIEMKMQNVSAVLYELAQDWIEGYKPLPHYQQNLHAAVVEALERDHRVRDSLAEYRDNVLPAPMPHPLATSDVLVEPPSANRRTVARSIGITTGPFGALADFQNRRLGYNGEEWVLGAEREQLRRAGRLDLARRIEWTSRDLGDGAGFDIASYRPDGTPLHIEVKTTNLGLRTPFHITRNEVEVSRRESDIWALYRVFDFRSQPRIYRLEGSVDDTSRLEPSVFVGMPL